jgi:hypothetical protein
VTLGVALTQRDTFQRDRRTPRCQWRGCRRPAGAHLLPGIWTGMQALGLVRPGTEALAGTLSVAVPLMLVVGLAAVPGAVLIGLLR